VDQCDQKCSKERDRTGTADRLTGERGLFWAESCSGTLEEYSGIEHKKSSAHLEYFAEVVDEIDERKIRESHLFHHCVWIVVRGCQEARPENLKKKKNP
jgi:hypothetical protein